VSVLLITDDFSCALSSSHFVLHFDHRLSLPVFNTLIVWFSDPLLFHTFSAMSTLFTCSTLFTLSPLFPCSKKRRGENLLFYLILKPKYDKLKIILFLELENKKIQPIYNEL
jgi:hypothetical protein